ncbi:MFS transporter [Bradyrhizobium sp. NP1]|uniref:MFS transporter n=1 Tax=Bradyrhizobium sp. NP1 TaxID=3049772 RepID=UPI0025A571AA|nr:MFS transporter [Bradyrhizobium sp. NP1]WJR77618.1 MFS transporter [Bradyrhizobium sp. NP1]
MSEIDVQKLADEAELNRFHYLAIAWVMAIAMLDGYDIGVTGAAMPAIMADLKIDATVGGAIASVSLVGMAIGSTLFGVMADRFGRKISVALAVAMFSLFTAAAGLVTSPVAFGALRFSAGLGLGGVIPILIAIATEYGPIKYRARIISLAGCGYAVGGIVVALIGKGLIESYGWQAIFLVAGVPVILVPLLLKSIPESLPVLVKQNRDAELREMVRRIAPDYPLRAEQRFVRPPEVEVKAAPIAQVFQEGRALSTLMFWVTNFSCLFMLYGLNTWLTKLMVELGYNLSSALTFVIAYNLGAMIGAFGGCWLLDKLHPKWVLVSFYVLSAASLVAMGFGVASSLTLVIVFTLGAVTLGTQILTNAYGGMFYPTAIRSTAIGLNFSAGRVGSIIAPVLIGWLVALSLPPRQAFDAIAVAGLIGAIAVAAINHEVSASRASDGAGVLRGRAARARGRPGEGDGAG